jgi:hypothetical protein
MFFTYILLELKGIIGHGAVYFNIYSFGVKKKQYLVIHNIQDIVLLHP